MKKKRFRFVVHLAVIVFLSQILLDSFESFGQATRIKSVRRYVYAQVGPLPSCLSRPYPRVFFSIFAGRQKYLSILFRYVFKLRSLNLITELHLWDFARNEGDSRFIRNASGSRKEWVKYFPVLDKTRWNDYYGHYATSLAYEEDDILLKVDDDILFLDVHNFTAFICAIEPRNTHFPNIVNNDVCAYAQSLHNVHNLLRADGVDQSRLARGFSEPLTGWYMDAGTGISVHRAFYSNQESFFVNTLHNFSSRVSINFFGMRVSTAQEQFPLMIAAYSDGVDDETFLSGAVHGLLPDTFNRVDLRFRVAHLSFSPQYDAGAAEFDAIARLYEAMSLSIEGSMV